MVPGGVGVGVGGVGGRGVEGREVVVGGADDVVASSPGVVLEVAGWREGGSVECVDSGAAKIRRGCTQGANAMLVWNPPQRERLPYQQPTGPNLPHHQDDVSGPCTMGC